MTDFINIKNNQVIPFQSIPVLKYEDFLEQNIILMLDEANHCVCYFGFLKGDSLKLICCMANDKEHVINVSSASIPSHGEVGERALPSFTARHLAFQIFEREIHENFGIEYTDHPWLKPVRFPFSTSSAIIQETPLDGKLPHTLNKAVEGHKFRIENYPFYQIQSEELHEVGVGPIHAGIIEPGHFRFICNGEQILHLEIQLGFQHRGIEKLFLEKKKLLQRTTLAESIAGDTAVGHTTAFVNLWESLCGFQAGEDLQFARTLALELERMAMHTGNLSGTCTDIAYQLGASVFGRLRTPLINFFQIWCGNRLAKGLIRPGYSHFYFSKELAVQLEKLLDAYEPDFDEIWEEFHTQPGTLGRMEKTGSLTKEQGRTIGTVGIIARMSAIERDIRASHPHDLYSQLNHQPVLKKYGDVYARVRIRHEEIKQSINYVRQLIKHIPEETKERKPLLSAKPNSFILSLTEGSRGEICHCAITDEKGELVHYKVKDPSMHNWLALALAVRDNEISDFPICNKSFDLSYCGHDL